MLLARKIELRNLRQDAKNARRTERAAARVAKRTLKWQNKWRRREARYALDWNIKRSRFDKKLVKWDKRAWKWGGRRMLFYPSMPRPEVVYI